MTISSSILAPNDERMGKKLSPESRRASMVMTQNKGHNALVKHVPLDPEVRIFMDRFKDHSRTAYHHEDDIWAKDDDADGVGRKLQRVASVRRGRMAKDHISTQIDPRDEVTPDSWIPRSRELVRLTGKHPLNAEPSITYMFDQGFITPVSMHYVRNHGKSPNIKWDSHTLTISGLVDKPTTFTMDDLAKMPRTTVPVTTCCSGQRRKELNMITKTIGFNWTVGAQSCNLWTGVKLSHLLELCGVDMKNGRFVWLEGAEAEELPNGAYGTSIDLVTAASPFEHVLIAFEQNGIPLHPDHGFPVRCVVPGYVGGRSVKWLENIIIMDRPSENFYHFHDNRILPSFVDTKLAAEEGWFYRDEYVYNQLNVNSVTVYPAHGETISAGDRGSYTIRGFGYSGGGRKITRVEISFDEGKTWELCVSDWPEERYSDAPKYGKYFAWMFWEFVMGKKALFDLAKRGASIKARAWDISNNTQPSEVSWNVMGMGNNSQYTVNMKVGEEFGNKFVEFLHPVAEAKDDSGWMKAPAPKEVPSKKKERHNIEIVSRADVADHNTENDAWIIIDGDVYDVTNYLKFHPGGAESIMINVGDDATEDFLAIHSEKAKTLLENFYVGSLGKDEEAVDEGAAEKEEDNLVALHPKKWREFELFERIDVSHDSRIFRFKLQSPEHRLGLPVGHHMFLQAPVDGHPIVRAYTPVSRDTDLGIFELCVKVYFPNKHPKFPEGGKMTGFLENMKIGDMIKAKGPLGHFEYVSRGQIVLNRRNLSAAKLGFIAGGSGLTPCYQILQAIFDDKNDHTEVHMLYANRTEEDILMREELDKMAAERGNIHIHYLLTQPSEGWTGFTGYVTKELIEKTMPEASPRHMICMCGPPLMITEACIPALTNMGYPDEKLVVF